MTNKTFREWEKPLLRRLVRPHKEESVLSNCKDFGIGGPSSIDDSCCQGICFSGCSQLSTS